MKMADTKVNKSIAEQTRKDNFQAMVGQVVQNKVYEQAKNASSAGGANLKSLFEQK